MAHAGATTEQINAQISAGYGLHQKGEHKQAQNLFRSVLKVAPKNATALCLMGACSLQLKDTKRAINFMSKAVKYAPDNAEFISNLGMAYRSEKLFDKALNCFKQSLAIDNTLTACKINLALTLKDLKRFDEAVNLMSEVVKSTPNQSGNLFTYGNLLFEAEKYDEAITAYQSALTNNERYQQLWVNLGNAYKLAGAFDKSLNAYDKALALDPNNSAVALNKGLMLLKLGQLKEGWAHYERRIDLIDFEDKDLKKINSPLWKGEDLKGKSIIIYTEQGFGDTFQFCRYVSWVKSLGAKVFFYGSQKIQQILSSLNGIDQWIAKGSPIPKHDYRISTMSLPNMYLQLQASFPLTTPYLKAKTEKIEQWKHLFPQQDKLKIGIVWQGNSGYIWDKFRSVNLDAFLPIILNDKTAVFSLQVDDPYQQLKKLIKTHPEVQDKIVDIGALIKKQGGTFDDTAGMLASLDLVISADTSMAHLTGALGYKVYTVLPYISEWRWGIDGKSITDYPSMTLFRQKTRNDWNELMTRVNDTL